MPEQPDQFLLIEAGGIALEAARAISPDPDADTAGAMAAAGPILEWMRGWESPADLAARMTAVRALLDPWAAPATPSQFVTAAEERRAAIMGMLDRPGTSGVTLPPRFAAALRNLLLAATFMAAPRFAAGRGRLLAEAAKYGGVTGPQGEVTVAEPGPADYDEVLSAAFAGWAFSPVDNPGAEDPAGLPGNAGVTSPAGNRQDHPDGPGGGVTPPDTGDDAPPQRMFGPGPGIAGGA